jgi:D-alanyl-D-alanine endopeptidase (penicillin-binding protein 7)
MLAFFKKSHFNFTIKLTFRITVKLNINFTINSTEFAYFLGIGGDFSLRKSAKSLILLRIIKNLLHLSPLSNFCYKELHMVALNLMLKVKSMIRFSCRKTLIAAFALSSILVGTQLAAAPTQRHHVKKTHSTKSTHASSHVKKIHGKVAKLKKKHQSIASLHKASKSKKSHKLVRSKALRLANVIERPSNGEIAGLNHSPDSLELASNVAFVVDQESSKVLFEKNAEVSLPIASITKLMTGLVVVEAKQDLSEVIEITSEDLDKEKGTGSRLRVGAKLSRADLLHIALMSSENRAASALGRSYPGGLSSFVLAMNSKAKQLGMAGTYYVDSSGLSSRNVASARDLVKLINAAYQHPLIREYSTDSKYSVNPNGGHSIEYGTTNKLVANSEWNIGLQKTGYIAEAGRCLVMQAIIEGRAVVMVFLDSKGKYSRIADAGRMKKWLQTLRPQA